MDREPAEADGYGERARSGGPPPGPYDQIQPPRRVWNQIPRVRQIPPLRCRPRLTSAHDQDVPSSGFASARLTFLHPLLCPASSCDPSAIGQRSTSRTPALGICLLESLCILTGLTAFCRPLPEHGPTHPATSRLVPPSVLTGQISRDPLPYNSLTPAVHFSCRVLPMHRCHRRKRL